MSNTATIYPYFQKKKLHWFSLFSCMACSSDFPRNV
jgi:hypothetical protein